MHIKIIILVIFLLGILTNISGEDFYNPSAGWAQNLVETWYISDYDPQVLSFSDSKGLATFQIFTLSADRYSDANSILRSINSALGAEFEEGIVAFRFNDHEAALSDSTWTDGQSLYRGYVLGLNDRSIYQNESKTPQKNYPFDYVLLSFSLASEFEVYHDFLLSNIDGFSPRVDDFDKAGLISQYLRDSGTISILRAEGRAGQGNTKEPRGGKSNHNLSQVIIPELISSDLEAAYATIEREARILQQYRDAPLELQNRAWRRYYQMLYKDSKYDTEEVAENITNIFQDSGIPRIDQPAEILAWIQGFAYRRTGTLSDLEPAILCLSDGEGDCDSLGLAYIAILEHLNFESILMISRKHAHSLVAVDIAGEGARFPFMNRSWLIAELTANVPIGSIAKDQANSEDWLGFNLNFLPQQ